MVTLIITVAMVIKATIGQAFTIVIHRDKDTQHGYKLDRKWLITTSQSGEIGIRLWYQAMV